MLTPATASADVLIGMNGERFVGKLIEETTNTVIFDSELGGRMTLPRKKIRTLELVAPVIAAGEKKSAMVVTNFPSSQSSSNLVWQPPGIGRDGFDWVQLKSGEWLRGEIKYIQNKEVEFDSDELDEMTLKLKDVRMAYPANPVFTKFYGREPAYGTVIISNDMVSVSGDKPLSLHRDDLTGITPGGQRERTFWTGNLNAGVSFQSGNTKQTTVTTMAELARRTPATTLLIDYLGDYSEVNNVQSANNDRVNLVYDIRLNRDWFIRAATLEYYTDPLANISSRLTGGVGAGYYIFDRDELAWTIAAGPSYQYTSFDTVQAGQAETATTLAGVFQSNFKADITKRLTFIQTLTSTFTDKEAGQYMHHSVTTLEFEIKHHLNLDVSYIWDYLMNPQTKLDGTAPKKSDNYLTVGLGIRF